MNVFEIQERLVRDYKSYVESFVHIRDLDIRSFVEREYAKGKYWPEALVQLNPAFAPGAAVDELVRTGVLHSKCEDIFRVGPDRRPMQFHRHQTEAIEAARGGNSYVLTTGTGSGKSLAYFVPMVDRVLRNGVRKGLKAIVVYPMNALCNSQLEELEKFLGPSESAPVSYRRYTGQESDEERGEIRANPPDILLTNYVMLELILTRDEDRSLLEKAGSIEFLVLDELHTYRGRQGADVAMLVRRVRERTGVERLQCVGTSATMASEGSFADRQVAVAGVATRLFGTPVDSRHVIGETLLPLFSSEDPKPEALRFAVLRAAEKRVPEASDAFLADPFAAWIERKFGLELVDGRATRVTPQTVTDGGNLLSNLIGIDEQHAASAIRNMLLKGHELRLPDIDRPLFAFRLHQFISRGDTVFSTLDHGAARQMTLDGQTVLPIDHERRLYPLSFCRSCGEEYFVIDMVPTSSGSELRPRDFRDISARDGEERTAGAIR